MKHNIIEEREDFYIVQCESGITTFPNTDYFTLKLKRFDGDKIYHTFECDDDIVRRVEETSHKIFNCYRNEDMVQIADDYYTTSPNWLQHCSNEDIVHINNVGIASAVLNKDVNAYDNIFARYNGIKI